MKNTDFMNLSLPEGTDKIDVEILNSDFKKLESEASKHYIKQQIEVDGTATIIGSIGPYVQLENLTDNILNVSIGDELIVLMKGDNRKIRTVSGENYGVVTNGAVRITYYINARTYADENFYKKEKVDELLSNVEATVEVDAELSETSENPVQNKVITAELASYATTEEVESKVAEKVAEIVAGAPEDFDTLKEMSDWLKEHEDSAAAMNSNIQKNAEDIATANENIETANENIAKKLNKKAICVNGADYNSFVATGFYEALGKAENPTQNSPNGNDTSNNFYVIVQQRAASYVSQFAISARNDTGVYVRTMSNSTWNAWRKLLDNTTEYAKNEDLATANTNISKNAEDIATANTNIQKNVDDITLLKEQVNNLLRVKTYGKSCFTKNSTQDVLITKDDMYLKESNYAWLFNPHITFITRIPANTETLIGTVSPPPPHSLIKRHVTINKNDNTGNMTAEGVVRISAVGNVYITSPTPIREDGQSGNQGRINLDTCIFEALKIDTDTATTAEGGE